MGADFSEEGLLRKGQNGSGIFFAEKNSSSRLVLLNRPFDIEWVSREKSYQAGLNYHVVAYWRRPRSSAEDLSLAIAIEVPVFRFY